MRIFDFYFIIKMKSPLRYPGGKTRAIASLTYIFETYYTSGMHYGVLLSPFCGGCSFEFSICKRFPYMCLNDKFLPLINFFKQCQTNREELVDELEDALGKIDKDDFLKYRSEIMKDGVDDLTKAFMYFIINRCSFSGATLSGGFSEESSEKRFTQSSIDNIKALDLSRSEFTALDFKDFMKKYDAEDAFIFCDPPYLLQKDKNKLYGENGDLHESFDHEGFHDVITKAKGQWMITYNDSPKIKEMYKDYTIIPASWSYGMNANKKSSEIIIINKQLHKGGIPHITGNIFEVETQKYFIDKGFRVERHGGSTTDPDIIVYDKDNNEYCVECKTSLKGCDLKECKLNYVENKYICQNDNEYLCKLINNNMPDNLFNCKSIPKGISSTKWNEIKRPTFSDMYVNVDDLDLSEIIQCTYIHIQDVGMFKLKDDDPLELEVPKFVQKYKIRYYVKNHSSSKSSKANLSAVATIRIQ